MPMPRWWGQINKRVFNPVELRRGKPPVIAHVGRVASSCGARSRTVSMAPPASPHPVFLSEVT